MSLLRKILTVVSYVGIGGGPIVAATGVGVPVGAAIGAVGIAAGAWLHWLDSPRTPQDVLDAAKASVDAAKAIQGAVKR